MKIIYYLLILFYAAPLLGSSEPCAIVIFGSTGDLTERKLMPALYNLSKDGELSPHTAIVGFGRADYTNETFRNKFAAKKGEEWKTFEKQIVYHRSDLDSDSGYESLKTLLSELDNTQGTQGNRLYYLAVPAAHFPIILKQLKEHGLIYPPTDKKWSRVIIEKPFGSDLKSAISLQQDVSKYLNDSQVYLMDHYLGKAGVHNIISLRFENGLFEPLWNNHHIDRIEITLSEDIGIGSRGAFWEQTGLLRDILQNHAMQILALTAMDPPSTLDAEHLHAEKIKLLNAIRPLDEIAVEKAIIRGQYGPGEMNGVKLPGYKEEKGVPANSEVETYVAAEFFIDNPRWKGVPFYIRAGKRLPEQKTEITVAFKKTYPWSPDNELVIKVQPDANIYLKSWITVPLLESKPSKDAYETLILNCIQGDRSHFVDAEEHISAWRLLTPVLETWQKGKGSKIQIYPAGTKPY